MFYVFANREKVPEAQQKNVLTKKVENLRGEKYYIIEVINGYPIEVQVYKNSQLAKYSLEFVNCTRFVLSENFSQVSRYGNSYLFKFNEHVSWPVIPLYTGNHYLLSKYSFANGQSLTPQQNDRVVQRNKEYYYQTEGIDILVFTYSMQGRRCLQIMSNSSVLTNDQMPDVVRINSTYWYGEEQVQSVRRQLYDSSKCISSFISVNLAKCYSSEYRWNYYEEIFNKIFSMIFKEISTQQRPPLSGFLFFSTPRAKFSKYQHNLESSVCSAISDGTVSNSAEAFTLSGLNGTQL